MDRINEFLKKEFNRTVTIKVPVREKKKIKNMYYWWRRFPIHKTLSNMAHYKEKIKNKDFDYSPYWAQIQYEYHWMAEDILHLRDNHRGGRDSLFQLEREIITSYNRRLKKLYEDADVDEANRIEYLKKELIRNFGGGKYDAHDFIDMFEGTIEEAFSEYPKWLINKKLNKIYENFA
jgi:hypothetical protein